MRWQRVMLLFVLAYEGLGALLGGGLLVAAPDGHLMDMPVQILHGFFPDFFTPGLILLGLGILNSAAFIAVFRRTRTDWLFAGVALGGLSVWFLTEILVIRAVVWLHAMWGLPVLLGVFMALPLIPSTVQGQSFIKRHPVFTFYALAFTLGWGGILVATGANGGLPTTPEDFSKQVGSMIPALLVAVPFASIVTIALVSGKSGLRDLFSGLLKWRVGARWYAVALLTAPLVYVVVHTGLSLASPVFLPGLVTSTDKVPFVVLGIAAALTVGFCEELGWTGLAFPRLLPRYGVLPTGLIVGVLWSAWHGLAVVVWPSVALAGDLSVAVYIAVGGISLLVGQLTAFRVLMVWCMTERTVCW